MSSDASRTSSKKSLFAKKFAPQTRTQPTPPITNAFKSSYDLNNISMTTSSSLQEDISSVRALISSQPRYAAPGFVDNEYDSLVGSAKRSAYSQPQDKQRSQIDAKFKAAKSIWNSHDSMKTAEMETLRPFHSGNYQGMISLDIIGIDVCDLKTNALVQESLPKHTGIPYSSSSSSSSSTHPSKPTTSKQSKKLTLHQQQLVSSFFEHIHSRFVSSIFTPPSTSTPPPQSMTDRDDGIPQQVDRESEISTPSLFNSAKPPQSATAAAFFLDLAGDSVDRLVVGRYFLHFSKWIRKLQANRPKEERNNTKLVEQSINETLSSQHKLQFSTFSNFLRPDTLGIDLALLFTSNLYQSVIHQKSNFLQKRQETATLHGLSDIQTLSEPDSMIAVEHHPAMLGAAKRDWGINNIDFVPPKQRSLLQIISSKNPHTSVISTATIPTSDQLSQHTLQRKKIPLISNCFPLRLGPSVNVQHLGYNYLPSKNNFNVYGFDVFPHGKSLYQMAVPQYLFMLGHDLLHYYYYTHVKPVVTGDNKEIRQQARQKYSGNRDNNAAAKTVDRTLPFTPLLLASWSLSNKQFATTKILTFPTQTPIMSMRLPKKLVQNMQLDNNANSTSLSMLLHANSHSFLHTTDHAQMAISRKLRYDANDGDDEVFAQSSHDTQSANNADEKGWMNFDFDEFFAESQCDHFVDDFFARQFDQRAFPFHRKMTANQLTPCTCCYIAALGDDGDLNTGYIFAPISLGKSPRRYRKSEHAFHNLLSHSAVPRYIAAIRPHLFQSTYPDHSDCLSGDDDLDKSGLPITTLRERNQFLSFLTDKSILYKRFNQLFPFKVVQLFRAKIVHQLTVHPYLKLYNRAIAYRYTFLPLLSNCHPEVLKGYQTVLEKEDKFAKPLNQTSKPVSKLSSPASTPAFEKFTALIPSSKSTTLFSAPFDYDIPPLPVIPSQGTSWISKSNTLTHFIPPASVLASQTTLGLRPHVLYQRSPTSSNPMSSLRPSPSSATPGFLGVLGLKNVIYQQNIPWLLYISLCCNFEPIIQSFSYLLGPFCQEECLDITHLIPTPAELHEMEDNHFAEMQKNGTLFATDTPVFTLSITHDLEGVEFKRQFDTPSDQSRDNNSTSHTQSSSQFYFDSLFPLPTISPDDQSGLRKKEFKFINDSYESLLNSDHSSPHPSSSSPSSLPTHHPCTTAIYSIQTTRPISIEIPGAKRPRQSLMKTYTYIRYIVPSDTHRLLWTFNSKRILLFPNIFTLLANQKLLDQSKSYRAQTLPTFLSGHATSFRNDVDQHKPLPIESFITLMGTDSRNQIHQQGVLPPDFHTKNGTLHPKEGRSEEYQIVQFYETFFGVKLKFPHLPFSAINSPSISSKFPLLVPWELLMIDPQQQDGNKLVSPQVSKLFHLFTKLHPRNRFLQYNISAKQILTTFHNDNKDSKFEVISNLCKASTLGPHNQPIGRYLMPPQQLSSDIGLFPVHGDRSISLMDPSILHAEGESGREGQSMIHSLAQKQAKMQAVAKKSAFGNPSNTTLGDTIYSKSKNDARHHGEVIVAGKVEYDDYGMSISARKSKKGEKIDNIQSTMSDDISSSKSSQHGGLFDGNEDIFEKQTKTAKFEPTVKKSEKNSSTADHNNNENKKSSEDVFDDYARPIKTKSSKSDKKDSKSRKGLKSHPLPPPPTLPLSHRKNVEVDMDTIADMTPLLAFNGTLLPDPIILSGPKIRTTPPLCNDEKRSGIGEKPSLLSEQLDAAVSDCLQQTVDGRWTTHEHTVLQQGKIERMLVFITPTISNPIALDFLLQLTITAARMGLFINYENVVMFPISTPADAIAVLEKEFSPLLGKTAGDENMDDVDSDSDSASTGMNDDQPSKHKKSRAESGEDLTQQSPLYDFVFTFCPGGADLFYGTIKHFCDVRLGVPTQCVAGTNILKRKYLISSSSIKKRLESELLTKPLQYSTSEYLWPHPLLSNLTLKMNAKLGNTNFQPLASAGVSRILQTPTLILGIDCDHPEKLLTQSLSNFQTKWQKDAELAKKKAKGQIPDEQRASKSASPPPQPAQHLPAHSCVVGSRDIAATKWAGIVQQQGSREELLPIEQTMHAVRRHIIMFKHHTGEIPRRIVIFRDGVGEQEAVQVIQQEILAILNTCRTIHPTYQPDIVCILVLKRHDIRFFYPQQSSSQPPTNTPTNSVQILNPPVGTVVDSNVTRFDSSEFYLVSHSPSRISNSNPVQVVSSGTTRPILYQVIYNTSLLRGQTETQITTEELSELAYYLCFQRQSTPQSSSVVLPVEHADRLGARARFWSNFYSPTNIHHFFNHQSSTPVKCTWDDVSTWEESLHPYLWELPFWL